MLIKGGDEEDRRKSDQIQVMEWDVSSRNTDT